MNNAFAPLTADFFRILDVLAVCVAATMGGIVARQRRFDIVGFMVLSIVTALGGGMVRDMLLDAKPVAIWDPLYLPAALVGALVAFFFQLNSKWTNRFLIIADAFVMASWSGLGAVKGLHYGTMIVPAILLGLLTGVGGGMIRDVCCGQVPSVFGGNYLYATPSILAATVATFIDISGHPVVALFVAALSGALFVIVARWRRWRLPQTGGIVISLNKQQLQALVRRAERKGRRDIINEAKAAAHEAATGLAESGTAGQEARD